ISTLSLHDALPIWIPLLAYAFVVYVTATGVLLLYTLVLRESLVPVGNVPRELLLFLAMAVIPQIGGHTLYNWSLRWVPAPIVSLSLVGEPIGSSLLAWVLLQQVPGFAVGIGGALALAGIYLTAMGQATVRRRGPPSVRWNEGSRIPLSRGMHRGDQTLDPGSPPRKLLLGPPVVRGHATEQLRPALLGIRATDIVLLSNGSTVVPFVMPEVEVPSSVEVANAGTASDF